MKTQIIFINIPRPHCIDQVLENIALADKPEDLSLLAVCAGPKEYQKELQKKIEYIFYKQSDGYFDKSRIKFVKNKDGWIDHDKIREDITALQVQIDKMLNVYKAYDLAMQNLDPTADYYWFIEDDTLFPLHTFTRYMEVMKEKNCDIVSGQSYYWHTLKDYKRNFWGLKEDKVFPDQDECEDVNVQIVDSYPEKDEGVVKLGATGLGNVLAKGEVVRGWKPMDYVKINNGADIAFFYYAQQKGFKAYGIYDISLPHITLYPDGGIEIRGKIHENIIKIVNKNYECK